VIIYNNCKNVNHSTLNKPTRIFPKINFKNTSSEEIANIIRSLRSKESCGYEEISIKILKINAPFISSPLTHIFLTELCLPEFFQQE